MKDLISTEGRVFAAQVSREVRRRERIGVAKLVSSLRPDYANRYAQHITVREASWTHGFYLLMKDFGKLRGPQKRIALLRKAAAWLDTIPEEDRGFVMHLNIDRKRFSSAPRSAKLTVLSLDPDTHPLKAMAAHKEHGIQAMRHEFEVKPSRDTASVSGVAAFVSNHALGRLRERWTGKPPTIHEGLLFAHLCWKFAEEATLRDELMDSGLNFPFGPGGGSEPVYAEGCMRISNDRQNERICNWFDCRTVLSYDMLQPEQLAQANAIAQSVVEGDSDIPIAAVEPRVDFVTQAIERERARS